MIENGAEVIITELPAGRRLPAALNHANGTVIDRSRYGHTYFYDIQLDREIEGFSQVSLIRESMLLVKNRKEDQEKAEKAIAIEAEEKARQQLEEIEQIKDELKAWPLPKKFDMNSAMYEQVWKKRMNLHAKLSQLMKDKEEKV